MTKKRFTYSLDILSILPVISCSLQIRQLPLSFPQFTPAFSAAAVSTHEGRGGEIISRCFTQLLYISFLTRPNAAD